MKELLLVFIGGGMGSVSRFLIHTFFQKISSAPIGTLIVNIVGSLIIGYLISAYSVDKSHWSRLIFVIGFCGGFTTFSTFSVDVITLIKEQSFLLAIIYALISVILSVFATFIGFLIPKLFIK